MPPIDQILDRLRRGSSAEYGSDRVSQLEHALQCATQAEEAGAAPALIIAALLHDIGHLVHDLGRDVARRGIDDRHEVRGRDWLGKWFAEDVTGPVRLHVDAKRYLCRVEPAYLEELSPSSIESLTLQGGPFTADEARDFEQNPYFQDAVALRRWDDAAKSPGLAVPDMRAYTDALARSSI